MLCCAPCWGWHSAAPCALVLFQFEELQEPEPGAVSAEHTQRVGHCTVAEGQAASCSSMPSFGTVSCFQARTRLVAAAGGAGLVLEWRASKHAAGQAERGHLQNGDCRGGGSCFGVTGRSISL